VPLCVGVAIVYKSIKCRTMKQVPKEAAILTMWILAGMAAVAIGLAVAVEAMERSYR
jgi:mannose/fructose/N-acetylgalactosamine-specific phosphotransferase system component IID